MSQDLQLAWLEAGPDQADKHDHDLVKKNREPDGPICYEKRASARRRWRADPALAVAFARAILADMSALKQKICKAKERVQRDFTYASIIRNILNQCVPGDICK